MFNVNDSEGRQNNENGTQITRTTDILRRYLHRQSIKKSQI